MVSRGEFDTSRARENLEALAANPYPGRGIVLGRSENPDELAQVYWVMGRSDNSRNRILAQDGARITTTAFDESKVEDPSLIIYNAMKTHRARIGRSVLHVVSNGDQTDSIFNEAAIHGEQILFSDPFVKSLFRREYEPDAPNFTPRITGAMSLDSDWAEENNYQYSIIRRNPTSGAPEHTFGAGLLEDIPAGTGLCFHTYQGDGDPLPSFEGSPYAIPLGNTTDEIAEQLWDSLSSENRVGLVVKTIDSNSGDIKDIRVINQLEK